jgi:hypothetical protein
MADRVKRGLWKGAAFNQYLSIAHSKADRLGAVALTLSACRLSNSPVLSPAHFPEIADASLAPAECLAHV